MHKDIKVLLVDDFSTMRRIIKKLLNEIGFKRIIEAEDGSEALRILKAGDIDFLVTDWNMPKMSGMELLEAVRADPKLARLPVLMVTAESKRDQITRAAMAGVNGYIIKPFSAATLQEKIEKILQRLNSNK